MEHVLVLSDDIQRTRDFYCDVVGLEVGERPPLAFPGYWLYADSAGASCIHIAERRAYAAHAAGLGLHVPERTPGEGRSTTSRSGPAPATTMGCSSGSRGRGSRR